MKGRRASDGPHLPGSSIRVRGRDRDRPPCHLPRCLAPLAIRRARRPLPGRSPTRSRRPSRRPAHPKPSDRAPGQRRSAADGTDRHHPPAARASPTSTDRAALNGLLHTAEQSSAGALLRVHLALTAADNPSDHDDDDVNGWLAIICDETAQLLHAATPHTRPFPLIAYAEHADQLAGSAIEALDRDSPTAQETIADCLARLLAITVIVTAARTATPA